MLLLIINGKPYMVSPMTFELKWHWKVKVKVSYILSDRRGVCYTYTCQYCITTVIYMSQKGLMQAGGVFSCPRGLSCYRYMSQRYEQWFNYQLKIVNYPTGNNRTCFLYNLSCYICLLCERYISNKLAMNAYKAKYMYCMYIQNSIVWLIAVLWLMVWPQRVSIM